MTAKIHVLHAAPSVAQQLWEMSPSLMRTRSSRSEVDRAVRAVKSEIAASELVGAFERYLAEDPDYRRFRAGNNAAGPPGLHRWVAWRRWEAWLPEDNHASTGQSIAKASPDNPIRTALVQALGEPFVRSYIDPFELIDGVLIVPEGKLTARARLLENREILRRCGVRSMRKPT